mmetsp:Transcript_7597/g.19496  ORF Transcript_7597/g.19496 Transcript_7597/m.19496 type:complete len:454 (+) Transcript_7597:1023-2384(+)
MGRAGRLSVAALAGSFTAARPGAELAWGVASASLWTLKACRSCVWLSMASQRRLCSSQRARSRPSRRSLKPSRCSCSQVRRPCMLASSPWAELARSIHSACRDVVSDRAVSMKCIRSSFVWSEESFACADFKRSISSVCERRRSISEEWCASNASCCFVWVRSAVSLKAMSNFSRRSNTAPWSASVSANSRPCLALCSARPVSRWATRSTRELHFAASHSCGASAWLARLCPIRRAFSVAPTKVLLDVSSWPLLSSSCVCLSAESPKSFSRYATRSPTVTWLSWREPCNSASELRATSHSSACWSQDWPRAFSSSFSRSVMEEPCDWLSWMEPCSAGSCPCKCSSCFCKACTAEVCDSEWCECACSKYSRRAAMDSLWLCFSCIELCVCSILSCRSAIFLVAASTSRSCLSENSPMICSMYSMRSGREECREKRPCRWSMWPRAELRSRACFS